VWLGAHVLRVSTAAAMWILMGRLLESESVVQFILIGQVAMVGASYAGWTVQAFTWDRAFAGTYPLLVAAPSSLVPPMMGRTAVWLLNGIATGLMTLVILVPMFWPSLPWTRIAWTVPLIGAICIGSYGFAFCLGSVVNWIPRLRNVLQNIAVIVMTSICGVVVPVSFWPVSVQAVANVLPVTHGLCAMRLVLDGQPVREAMALAAAELALALVWFALGVVTLDFTVNTARRTGAIDIR
jgi:ABC-2 type transport system permease protein